MGTWLRYYHGKSNVEPVPSLNTQYRVRQYASRHVHCMCCLQQWAVIWMPAHWQSQRDWIKWGGQHPPVWEYTMVTNTVCSQLCSRFITGKKRKKGGRGEGGGGGGEDVVIVFYTKVLAAVTKQQAANYIVLWGWLKCEWKRITCCAADRDCSATHCQCDCVWSTAWSPYCLHTIHEKTSPRSERLSG